ncbi:MAG TPA: hypothetical protein VKP66_00775 [Steroidobacteraceae bacterium]|nr:hypothetical protein [Steroidobacteraceae bacterium]
MARIAGLGLLVLVGLSACTHFKGSSSRVADAPARPTAELPAPAESSTPPTPTTAGATAAEPQATESPPALPPESPPSVPKASPPPATADAAPRTAHGSGARTAATSAAGTPVAGTRVVGSQPSAPEQHGSPAAAQTATVQRAAQPAARPPSPPALDLAGLEQRLKDTHAIGLFTKLSLKNQVDDLLGAFRTFHAGQIPPSLPELRERYDLLLLKVLTLLQDGDPPLASAISASREAIWGLLADRDKFQKIQMG